MAASDKTYIWTGPGLIQYQSKGMDYSRPNQNLTFLIGYLLFMPFASPSPNP